MVVEGAGAGRVAFAVNLDLSDGCAIVRPSEWVYDIMFL